MTISANLTESVLTTSDLIETVISNSVVLDELLLTTVDILEEV